MAGSTISSTITTPVTLGVAGYTGPLSITSKGAIEPAATFATALYVPGSVKVAMIRNSGIIMGGTDAGTGIRFSGTGTITNFGGVIGGIGSAGSTGGVGIEITNNTTLLNFGSILGGMGGPYSSANPPEFSGEPGGTGGNGVSISAGLVINYGLVQGGTHGVTGSSSFYAGRGGVGIYASGTVNIINKGVIAGGGNGGNAIDISGDSYLLNKGTIIGGVQGDRFFRNGIGVYISGSLAGFNNLGLVTVGTLSGYGVSVNNGATVKNSGTISSSNSTMFNYGVGIYAGYFLNSGLVVTPYGTGVNVEDSGVSLQATFINTGTVAVTSSNYAVYGGIGLPLIDNKNLIEGGRLAGVALLGGTLINSGTIFSNLGTGVYASIGDYGVDRSVTIINAGYIHGAVDALSITNTLSNDVVIVEPHATFSGNVVANTSLSDILEVAGTSSTALSGIGTSITNFRQISFASGAHWAIEGNTIGLASGQTITGFTVGDTIILDGFAATSDSYTSNGLVLTEGTSHVTLDITGSFTTASFNVVDPPAETTITLVCYLRGTKILTPVGEVAVEDLKIGDPVITRFNGYRPIKWIGRQSYARRFIADNYDEIPVRISAAALGKSMPKRDLYVSPGHSMLIDGKLILAKSLVNGITITQDDCPALVEYFQIEFETHDCILAEGAWSESYADTPGLRGQFHNVAEFYALYPEQREPVVQKLCADRPLAGPELDAALRPIISALQIIPGPLHGCIDEVSSAGFVRGWAWDAAHPHLPVLLEIVAGGRFIGTVLACDFRVDLQRAGIGRGYCGFTFASPEVGVDIMVRRRADSAEISPPRAMRAA